MALLTLSACDRQGAWSDLSLKKNIREAGLDSRDGGLATRICFGVLQNRMLCDFYIGKYSSVKVEKLENRVLNALRIGVYQLAFLSKIPASAAVNESVELARKHSKNPRSPALVNGILRNLARNIERLPTIDQKDQLAYLSTRYSHPLWLVDEFVRQLGMEETERLLEVNNSEPPTTAQINTTRATVEEVFDQLVSAGVKAEHHTWMPDCITFSGGGDLEQLPPFQEGKLYIQDVGAKLAVLVAAPKAGMKVLDACASPGGKSFATAIQMEGQGSILSCDIHPHKKKLIETAAKRMGFDCIQAAVLDGKKHQADYDQAFDLVLADVPCSGLGIIRKKPDIRYKDPKPLAGLPAIQLEILENVSAYVKAGGGLLYCTCTIVEEENQGVLQQFLAKHPEFSLEAFEVPHLGRVEEGQVTLWPHRHGTDGFYIAKLRRQS